MNGPPPPSPMHPVPPPSKKHRSEATGDALSTQADDAIARRRAELYRLQQMQTRKQQEGGLLDQAKSQLGGTAPPMPPPGRRVARARHSDIFPSVKKPPPVPADSAKKPTPQVARRLAFEEKTRASQTRAKSAPPMRAPPPPVPPPSLVAEAPPSMQRTKQQQQQRAPPPMKTPVQRSGAPPTTTGGSTARRDILRNLRECADTPPSKEQHQPTQHIRMAKELKQAQDEKADALRKVARLREQVQQLQKKQEEPSLETVLHVADQRGETEAVQWARRQVQSESSPQQPPASKVGFLSPLQASATPRRGSRSAVTPLGATRKRVSTPHPKLKDRSEERKYLAEAAKTIPHEYYSSQATYVVRRPHVMDVTAVWDSSPGAQSFEAYQAQVDANKPSTLEVVAKITADGSVLTLCGTSTVRHKNATTQEWKVFEDVDEMDDPLGCVLYIDGHANEKEYWLDAIYEEAFATREAYCSSLISTASALQAKKDQVPSPVQAPPSAATTIGTFPPQKQTVEVVKEVERPRPPISDACVGTDDDLIVKEEEKKPASEKPPSKKPKELPAEEEESSSDVLSVFIGMLFSSLFSLVWLVLVRIPFKIFTFSLLIVMTAAFLSIVWLYLADDHGAEMMGAGMQYGFNRPGIV